MRVHSVELMLDAANEDAVRAEWRALADAGLPNAGTNPSESNRPHVTLAASADPLEDAVPALRDAVTEVPLTLTLGGPLLFGRGDRGFVLARHVVVTSALLRLHHRVLDALGAHRVLQHSAVDDWTPHVTLARRMPAERLPEALALVATAPLEATAASARLWNSETRTITELG